MNIGGSGERRLQVCDRIVDGVRHNAVRLGIQARHERPVIGKCGRRKRGLHVVGLDALADETPKVGGRICFEELFENDRRKPIE